MYLYELDGTVERSIWLDQEEISETVAIIDSNGNIHFTSDKYRHLKSHIRDNIARELNSDNPVEWETGDWPLRFVRFAMPKLTFITLCYWEAGSGQILSQADWRRGPEPLYTTLYEVRKKAQKWLKRYKHMQVRIDNRLPHALQVALQPDGSILRTDNHTMVCPPLQPHTENQDWEPERAWIYLFTDLGEMTEEDEEDIDTAEFDTEEEIRAWWLTSSIADWKWYAGFDPEDLFDWARREGMWFYSRSDMLGHFLIEHGKNPEDYPLIFDGEYWHFQESTPALEGKDYTK